jgi:hypothetical protein
MPLERALQPLYKDAMNYYKAAYRAYFKTNKNWTQDKFTTL